MQAVPLWPRALVQRRRIPVRWKASTSTRRASRPSTLHDRTAERPAQDLPFDDKRDFEEAKQGFIAAPAYKQIMAEAGNVAWDMGSYEFLLQGKDFDSIHPSLQRQAILNMAYGLYEVVPGQIYQVRGFDLANITFITRRHRLDRVRPADRQGDGRARRSTFVNEKLGERPVVAVVYSHSHVDHFGGVRGVVDEADVRSGKVQIIAPDRLHGARRLRERLRRQRDEPARCSTSTACCCRAARSATSTRRSARASPRATSA